MHLATGDPGQTQRVLRFGIVGLANTAIGYAVILFGLRLGLGDILSNIGGYAVGLIASFFLNGRWTFADRVGDQRSRFGRFILVFIASYAANLLMLLSIRAAGIESPLAHLAGMACYTAVFYLGSTIFVFVDRPAPDKNQRTDVLPIFVRRWPELALVVGWMSAFAAMHGIAVSHDVYWQMWIARQMLGGAKLYSDIIEINPPLWFWMALPVERLAEAASLPPVAVMVATIFLYIGAALATLSVLVRDRTAGVRAAILFAALVAMTFLSMRFFGQREHLAMISALPYAALIGKRGEGLSTGRGTALVVGLIAAMGFALKHYFVFVPLALEFWLFWRLRRNWRPVRPELLVLCASAILYATAVLFLAPDFLEVMVPMVSLAYGGYEVPLLALVQRPFVWGWLFAAVVGWKYRDVLSPLATAAFVAASAFCLSYFLQAKGWGYHAEPVIACAFFAVAVVAADRVRKAVDLRRHPAMVAALVTPLAFATLWGAYTNPNSGRIDQLLKGVESGVPVAMLTANPSNIWPMVIKEGYQWPSRYYSFWKLHSIAKEELKDHGRLTGRMAALADEIRSDTVRDFTCNPPEIIIVDDMSDFPAMLSSGFDVVDFFEKDADFRHIFAQYHQRAKLGRFTSYEKSSSWRPARPSGCNDLR